MSITKAEMRRRVRESSGDPELLAGTAAIGSTEFIVNSAVIIQPVNKWRGFVLYITDTTDDSAPFGESGKKIFSSSANEIVLEVPFTVAVDAGDTFGVAVFDNKRIDDQISAALADFSAVKKHKFTEPLNMTNGVKRISPTSAAAQGFYPERVEFFSNSGQQQITYLPDKEWWWDDTLKQIEWRWWWSEQKTLTIFAARDHVMPAADATALTLEDQDIHNVVDLASINVLLSLTDSDLRDATGKLKVKRVTYGDVTIEYPSDASSYTKMRQELTKAKQTILAKYHVGMMYEMASIPDGARIDYKADPDGYPAPQVFWELERR